MFVVKVPAVTVIEPEQTSASFKDREPPTPLKFRLPVSVLPLVVTVNPVVVPAICQLKADPTIVIVDDKTRFSKMVTPKAVDEMVPVKPVKFKDLQGLNEESKVTVTAPEAASK